MNSTIMTLMAGLVLSLTSTAPANSQSLSPAEVKQSDIVFIGTVLKVHSTSFADMPQSVNNIVVKVDSILEKLPTAVMLRDGDSVTVVTKDPSKFREGMHATFYTASWVFGEGVGVREIGHEIPADPEDPPNPGHKKEEQMQARKAISDMDLRAKVESADLIVVGQVKDIRPVGSPTAGSPGSKAPITEHDPEWQEAVIHVESTIKPSDSTKEVVVHFPASIDVAWYDAPKLKVGQEGTFILRRDKVSGMPTAILQNQQVQTYVALSPGDVLNKDDAKRVRLLVSK
jgi:hypothetical protein